MWLRLLIYWFSFGLGATQRLHKWNAADHSRNLVEAINTQPSIDRRDIEAHLFSLPLIYYVTNQPEEAFVVNMRSNEPIEKNNNIVDPYSISAQGTQQYSSSSPIHSNFVPNDGKLIEKLQNRDGKPILIEVFDNEKIKTDSGSSGTTNNNDNGKVIVYDIERYPETHPTFSSIINHQVQVDGLFADSQQVTRTPKPDDLRKQFQISNNLNYPLPSNLLGEKSSSKQTFQQKNSNNAEHLHNRAASSFQNLGNERLKQKNFLHRTPSNSARLQNEADRSTENTREEKVTSFEVIKSVGYELPVEISSGLTNHISTSSKLRNPEELLHHASSFRHSPNTGTNDETSPYQVNIQPGAVQIPSTAPIRIFDNVPTKLEWLTGSKWNNINNGNFVETKPLNGPMNHISTSSRVRNSKGLFNHASSFQPTPNAGINYETNPHYMNNELGALQSPGTKPKYKNTPNKRVRFRGSGRNRGTNRNVVKTGTSNQLSSQISTSPRLRKPKELLEDNSSFQHIKNTELIDISDPRYVNIKNSAIVSPSNEPLTTYKSIDNSVDLDQLRQSEKHETNDENVVKAGQSSKIRSNKYSLYHTSSSQRSSNIRINSAVSPFYVRTIKRPITRLKSVNSSTKRERFRELGGIRGKNGHASFSQKAPDTGTNNLTNQQNANTEVGAVQFPSIEPITVFEFTDIPTNPEQFGESIRDTGNDEQIVKTTTLNQPLNPKEQLDHSLSFQQSPNSEITSPRFVNTNIILIPSTESLSKVESTGIPAKQDQLREAERNSLNQIETSESSTERSPERKKKNPILCNRPMKQILTGNSKFCRGNGIANEPITYDGYSVVRSQTIE